jgi:hypothetical protein
MAEAEAPRVLEGAYVKSGGLMCIFCLSPDISVAKRAAIDGKEGSQEIVCCDCGGRWLDILRLTGYEVLGGPTD